MDPHHIQPGYGQDNYMYGDPAIAFSQTNNDYMFPGGRAMSPPPGDEEAGPAHLPSALEEVLAYTEHRAREVGVEPGQIHSVVDKSGNPYNLFLSSQLLCGIYHSDSEL